jgi:pyridoxal 5'-phosphate synthase pdxT subunit
MIVGVLALQGDVPEHRDALTGVPGASEVLLVRTPAALRRVDALLLPGGESTAIADLLRDAGLWDPLAERLHDGLPVLGTCAGLILLAKRLEPSPSGRDPRTFGVLDVTVRRNDYGRQAQSFEGPVRVEGIRGRPVPGVFIRAPRIVSVGSAAHGFAFRGAEVVGAREGHVWGLTFHPELSGDPRLIASFLAAAARQTRT